MSRGVRDSERWEASPNGKIKLIFSRRSLETETIYRRITFSGQPIEFKRVLFPEITFNLGALQEPIKLVIVVL